MLTKDLLRFRLKDGRLEPLLLKPTPANVDLAANLIAHWSGGIGRMVGELEDEAVAILHESRALVAARGLQKVLLDQCTLADAASTEALRAEALAASAARLKAPDADGDAHRAAVAAQLGVDADALAERLYGDLPDRATVTAAPTPTAEALLAQYNLALCQGLLLHADELTVTLHDADTGLRRKLLKAVRWRRLLARVAGQDGGALTLVVSGPASVLEQSTRYGLQLALWLPALCCARSWSAQATVRPPRAARGETAVLTLDDRLGLPGDSAFLGHVPAELRELQATLAAGDGGFAFTEPQLLPLPDGEIVVPDLQFSVDGATWRVELFHRWHGRALARRIEQARAGRAPGLLLGVDRALAKTTAIAPLLADPVFAQRGFLFSDLPSARGLREVVARATST